MRLHDTLTALEEHINQLKQLPDQDIESMKGVTHSGVLYQSFTLPVVDDNVHAKVVLSNKLLDLEP